MIETFFHHPMHTIMVLFYHSYFTVHIIPGARPKVYTSKLDLHYKS